VKALLIILNNDPALAIASLVNYVVLSIASFINDPAPAITSLINGFVLSTASLINYYVLFINDSVPSIV